MIRVIKTQVEFDTLQQRWDELFVSSSSATPYQSFKFNKLSWIHWRNSNDILYIICYHKQEENPCDAIIPCYLHNDSELRLIDFMSDFCDIIVSDELSDCYDMYYEIFQEIIKDKDVKYISFSNLRYDSRLFAYFSAFGKAKEIQYITGYTIMNMTPSPSDRDFIASIPNINSCHRKNLRKYNKKSQEFDFSYMTSSDSSFPEKEIHELADYMIRAGMRKKEYFNESFFYGLRALYNEGIVKIAMNKKKGKVQSCLFLLNKSASDDMITWIILYKHKDDNIMLNMPILKMMYEQGILSFNQARGLYTYKLQNYHPKVFNLYKMNIYRSKKDMNVVTIKIMMHRIKRYAQRKIHCI